MVISLFYRTKIINKECNLVAFGIFLGDATNSKTKDSFIEQKR